MTIATTEAIPLRGTPGTEPLDLSACAREPIHVPGTIQPYGILIVADPASGVILQAATDAVAGVTGDALLGLDIGKILPGLDLHTGRVGTDPVYLGAVAGPGGGTYHAVAHRSLDSLILELERALDEEPGSFEDIYPLVRSFFGSLDLAPDMPTLCTLAATEVRRLTGFDRVMIYRFDEQWNGTVVAEDRNEELPSYLDLRFPASDIPAQARELYRRNRLRLIADAEYQPVPIEPALHPATGAPADLSLAMLRSVSPVHLQYMRNMGTGASMSISLMRGEQLWGLISCHNRLPRRVPYHVRTACELLGQTLSLQIGAKEQAADAERRIDRRAIHSRLLATMAAEEDPLNGLEQDGDKLLQMVDATGAAVVLDGECRRLGNAPPVDAIAAITRWLGQQPARDELVATHQLSALLPEAAEWTDTASGLLASPISQLHDSYILWFRPEVVRTVRWGGNPHKPADAQGGQLTPRTSFEAWRETVRDRSLPWQPVDREMAVEFRSTMIDIVLRRAEELAQLNEQLVRSNKELEAFSYSVSHDLRAPFRHIAGFSELLLQSASDRLTDRDRHYVSTIIDAAKSAGTLVDSLLHFAQMGRTSLGIISVDMNLMIDEVRQQLRFDIGDRAVEWRIDPLPPVRADAVMLRQVVQNLLSNAVKFTRGRDPAVIEIRYDRIDGEDRFEIRDNGCGFDMAYVDKLFGVFQRLHHSDEFEGTGIGLANVRRIVERHGGRVWAEGRPGEGASFHFTLPVGKGA